MSTPHERDTFPLDGTDVPFEPGQTIMQAALAAGLYIPHLCYHPEFKPHGSCKVCTVKRERPHGRRVHARRRSRASRSSATTPELEREPAHAGADAVRRGQPLLPVVREERQLHAAGGRLRPRGAVDRPRPLLPRPARRRVAPRRPARLQPLHPVRAVRPRERRGRRQERVRAVRARASTSTSS